MRLGPVLAFAACSLIWGSTWLVIKVGYEGVGAFTAASLRFGTASLALLVVALALRLRVGGRALGERVGFGLPRWPRGREWRLVVLVGLVLFTVDYGLIYWGEQFLASGVTAVLFSTLPLFTALYAHATLANERLGPRRLTGVLLGVVGVVLLFGEGLSFRGAPAAPMIAIVLSALCAASASVATKRDGHSIHPVTLTGTAAGAGALGLAGLSFLAGEGMALPTTAQAWWAIAYLSLLGSVVAFLLYFWLLRQWPATSVSFVTIFAPVVAVLLGAAVLREPVTWALAAGTAAVVVGVALASTGPGSLRATFRAARTGVHEAFETRLHGKR